MHVLYASHRYHPVPGGTERLVQSLAEGLVQRGHSSTVVTQREPGVPVEEQIGGVRVVRLKTIPIVGSRWPRGYISFLRRSGADLFHPFGNRIWCVDHYLPRARRFRWPHLLTGLGFYQHAMHRRFIDRIYFEHYFPRAVRAFNRYVASTDREAGQMVQWGFPAERIVRFPLGVDLREFASVPDGLDATRLSWGIRAPHIAVYAGGFFENKRVDRLVDALSRTSGAWGLVLVGRDVPESPCSVAASLARAHQLGVEVRVLGVLPRIDVVRALFAADAVVLGSQYEGFGLLLLEAMAAGRPFVSFDAGAAAELAATGAGISVGSVEEFAGALDRLNDANLRRAMGSVGRVRVTDYSMDRLLDRHLELYQQLLAEHHRA